jgi:membrane associated rhomboid family serine protease/Zn-finger nucleic acid-binding protein
MREVPLTVSDSPQPLVLDLCTTCQFLWFDHGERERLISQDPPVPPSSAEVDLVRNLNEAESGHAIEALELFAQERANRPETEADLGLMRNLLTWVVPVEETHPVAHPPLVTWVTLALVAAVSILAFGDLEQAVMRWGFIPAEAGRLAGLTAITSFFIHGGWLHLLGNLYFLYVTGDNVEDFLGPKRFILLLALATIAGAIAHGMVDAMPDRPCVGASGGISGVMAFYALRFPRVGLFIRFFIFWVFRIPFWAWFAFWTLLQLGTASEQLAGVGEISGAAHLGGALCGAALWAVWKKGRLAL